MGAVLRLVEVMLQVSTSGLRPVNAPFSLLAYLLQPALALSHIQMLIVLRFLMPAGAW